ncbi:MAG: hypothetical protein R2799_14265 [Crocinitomicaceae bacterium]
MTEVWTLFFIADGCVVPSKNEKDEHWTEWAKNIIEGLIGHMLLVVILKKTTISPLF